MPYFPILSAPNCVGETVLYNFPPNDWECIHKDSKVVNLSWADGDVWRSRTILSLDFGETVRVSHDELVEYLPSSKLPLLSLTDRPLPENLQFLPVLPAETHTPEWRATLRIKSERGATSYQGEINPFPDKGSLLSFAPFIQFSNNTENYLLFLNIESSPCYRDSTLSIYDAAELSNPRSCAQVFNNRITVIPLDGLGFNEENLPLLISKKMTGIPLFFSVNQDMSIMSLEHTHPPVSYAIHGKRFEAQKILKKKWFEQVE
jgi:hypothetical protein